MNLNQFTIKAQESVKQAFQIASSMNQQAIETGHLLKGVLLTEEQLVKFLFEKIINVNVN